MGFTDKPDVKLIREIKKYYSNRDGVFAIQIPPHLVTEEVSEILRAEGFNLKNYWTRFVRSTEPVNGIQSDLEVREISESESRTFGRIVTEIFDLPDTMTAIAERSVGKPGWKHFMAYDRKVPIATGSVYINNGMSWNGFAATLPEFRGRGAQASLLAQRISTARSTGCSFNTTETHPDIASFRNMLRYGYRLLYKRPNFVNQ